MTSELQPEALRGVASDLIAATRRLEPGGGSCPAALPAVAAELNAALQTLSAEEQAVAAQAANAVHRLADDLDQRVHLVRSVDGPR